MRTFKFSNTQYSIVNSSRHHALHYIPTARLEASPGSTSYVCVWNKAWNVFVAKCAQFGSVYLIDI